MKHFHQLSVKPLLSTHDTFQTYIRVIKTRNNNEANFKETNAFIDLNIEKYIYKL